MTTTLGWGSYSRQWQSQFAVFLLDKPVAITPGSRIRIELKQDKTTSGDVALAIRRGRYWVSSERRLDSTSAVREVHLPRIGSWPS